MNQILDVNKNKGLVFSMRVQLMLLQRIKTLKSYFCQSLTVACFPKLPVNREGRTISGNQS
jgi:hypothetical protein